MLCALGGGGEVAEQSGFGKLILCSWIQRREHMYLSHATEAPPTPATILRQPASSLFANVVGLLEAGGTGGPGLSRVLSL